jgi:hypothetical protein
MSASAGADRNPSPSSMVRAPNGAPPVSDFSPLTHLLHELNQPLTGLQCSLELAAVGPRTAQQYLRAIREGLGLVARMRMLVEALREVTDIAQEGWTQQNPAQPRSNHESSTHETPAQESRSQELSAQDGPAQVEAIGFDTLIWGTIDDLRPVAESRGVRIDVDRNSFPHLCAARRGVATAMFRLFESALSLAERQSVLRVCMNAQIHQAAIVISWTEETGSAERPAFSPPVLGLLVARAAWQRAGGQWKSEIFQANQTITILLPWASDNRPHPASGDRP